MIGLSRASSHLILLCILWPRIDARATGTDDISAMASGYRRIGEAGEKRMSDIGRYIAKLFAFPAYFMKDWRQDFVMPLANELGLRPIWGDIIEAENYYRDHPKNLGKDRQSYIIGKTQSEYLRKVAH